MFQQVQYLSQPVATGFPITQAVVNGTEEGRMYEYNGNHFVIHKSGFSSVIQVNDCLDELIEFFQSGELPQYFHVYAADEQLISRIQQLPDVFNTRIRERIQLEYRGALIKENETDDLEFTIVHADEHNYNALDVFNLDLGSRFWNSKEEFVKNALGNIVLNAQKEPVAICYAAAVADGKAEVDVMTLEAYRGQGLAKTAVRSFVNNCIENGVTANWDCFEENYASLATALKLNFTEHRKYIFGSIYKR